MILSSVILIILVCSLFFVISFHLDSLRFKVYGQQCKRCDDDDFHNPRWYKEEVTKVLNNVHQKIGEVCLAPFSALT